MIHFRVEGPYKIKKSRKKQGYSIDKEAVRRFWTENQHIADEVGCYVFSLRTGRGLMPFYVGQSKTGFRHECFTDDKICHYHETIVDHCGTPFMFFLVKHSGPNAILETCLNQVENYLIQLASQRNPHLENVKRVAWSVHGIFNSPRGQPSHSAKQLRRLLGISRSSIEAHIEGADAVIACEKGETLDQVLAAVKEPPERSANEASTSNQVGEALGECDGQSN
jgi:hypothetical protein